MGTSKNPAKKAAAEKKTAKKTAAKKAAPRRAGSRVEDFKLRSASSEGVTSDISAFKKHNRGVVITLPSGLSVRARRVELQTFILQGSVPNPLMEIITQALEKGQKADLPQMVGVEEGKIDLDMVNDMFEMVERVVVECVIEPKIHPAVLDDMRDDDLLYVDEVDAVDKMFIFQWAVGGTSNLEQFLEEARTDMDALAEMQGTS